MARYHSPEWTTNTWHIWSEISIITKQTDSSENHKLCIGHHRSEEFYYPSPHQHTPPQLKKLFIWDKTI